MSRGPDPAVSAEEIISFMVQHPDKAFTAKEIGEEFGKTRQWADNRLKDIEDDELVESKNPGGRSRFYWVTKAGKELLRDRRSKE